MSSGSLAVCIAEDRPSEEIAVKLLILSLSKHCPGLKVHLIFPPANDDFRHFIQRFPHVTLREEPLPGSYGWNVKPHALMHVLQQGHDAAMWIDSDIILNADFRDRLNGVDDSTIVVTEEPQFLNYSESGQRAAGWGFKVGRALPFCANSCVVRVTQAHIPLLKKWQELLESDTYKHTQENLPFAKRPLHMKGDQDVLTSLLEGQEFSSIPVKVLYSGQDIVQYHTLNDYSAKDRLVNVLKGLPPFIHSQGLKPWWDKKEVAKRVKHMAAFKALSRSLFMDISPYKYVATHYKRELDGELNWLETRSPAGIIFKIIGLGNPSLTGLPLVLAQHVASLSKMASKR